jgi:hypothetical protein
MKNPDEHAPNPPGQRMSEEEDPIVDLHDISRRLGRGLGQMIGLALLGLVIAAVTYLVASTRLPVSTSTRVIFAFPGLEKGEYPNQSKFEPDDLRAPEIIAEALKRQRLDTSDEFQSQIRGALDIESVIPPEVMKQRDRMQAAGQSLPFYQPDEYIVTLSLPKNFPINEEQRSRLLNEITGVYREDFGRTFTGSLAAFGHVFDVLRNADYPEYEQVFNREIADLTDYLSRQLQQDKSFRSPTTHLSFQDLLEQTQLFIQDRLSEPLELIHQGGLSRNRALEVAKMEHSLRNLDQQEHHAAGDQKVFTDLLNQPQAWRYVLDAKSQANLPYPEIQLLDQASDPLLPNNTGGFLVLRAIAAGLKVSQLQADKALLLEQLDALKSAKEDLSDTAQVQKLLNDLEPAYHELIDNIRKTQADFARQQFANAIRISAAVSTTGGIFRKLALIGAVGCFLGLAAGMGLSLLGIYVGSAKRN